MTPYPSDSDPRLRERLQRIRFLAFEGGGILGLAYLGVLRWLERLGVLGQVEGAAGSSAGALTALLVALRLPLSRIEAIVEETPWRAFPANPSPWRFLRSVGLCSHDKAREWIVGRLAEAGLSPATTFAELAGATGVRLWVPVTLEAPAPARAYIYSPETTPDATVADVVLASMSVPFLWPAVQLAGGRRGSDGGLSINHPLDVFRDRPDDEVLGVRVDASREIAADAGDAAAAIDEKPRGLGKRFVQWWILGRVLTLFDVARDTANRAHVDRWNRVVRIDTRDVGFTEFDLPVERRRDLVRWGEEAVCLFETHLA